MGVSYRVNERENNISIYILTNFFLRMELIVKVPNGHKDNTKMYVKEISNESSNEESMCGTLFPFSNFGANTEYPD
jgi:hypothetical protein